MSYVVFLLALKWNQNRLFASASHVLDKNSVALLGTVRFIWFKEPVMNLWPVSTNEDYECVYMI